MMFQFAILSLMWLVFVGCTFLPPVEETSKPMTLGLLRSLEKDPSTEIHRTGFVRTDQYDWLNDMWVGAQSAPVGVCIDTKFGVTLSSQCIDRVLVPQNGHIVTVWSNYNSSGCSGTSRMGVAVVPREASDQQVDTTAHWVKSYEEAIMKDRRAGSTVIISSYHTARGCVGEAAEIAVLPVACAVRQHPHHKYGYGTFKCDPAGRDLVYTRYGPFDNKELTYTDCREYKYEERENDEYPVETCLQPLECTRVENEYKVVKSGDGAVGSEEGEEDGLMVYQTVTCVD